jgi:glutathione synthase/RimK-type ligase-like ATP-grasp enzyme
MKIAIHHIQNGTFSERWVAYCKEKNISFKIVNCYSNSIINDLIDCDALLWHHNHSDPRDILFAKQLLFSLEQAGKKVFPNFDTAWHFDDKVGQKYLLEGLKQDLVKSFVFYSKSEALDWVGSTTFPKVFKLRGGAGSANVKLAKDKNSAIQLINIAFGKGFSQYNGWINLKERFRKYKNGKTDFKDLIKGIVRLFYKPRFATIGRDKGYIYFQDFIANNDHDIRVVVIDKKAFAIKRMIRENDFRASGSGNILYSKSLFDDKLIKKSFELANKLNSQCLAIDYVFDNNQPLIVEISYGFSIVGYDPCEGYWDESMNWHVGSFNACGWMVELLINDISGK